MVEREGELVRSRVRNNEGGFRIEDAEGLNGWEGEYEGRKVRVRERDEGAGGGGMGSNKDE